MGKVLLVASGKGGPGKTMFSVNMCATLAQRCYNGLLIDMDMGLRNMDLYLGMENRVVYNIMDVLSGLCRISKAIMRVDGFSSLYFMAAAPKLDERDITPLHMEILCAKLKEVFDYIIIDCPAGLGEMLEVSLAPADKAIIVTEPEFAASRDADMTERFIRDNGLEETYVVLNRVNVELMREGFMPDLNAVTSSFTSPLVGIIQEDDNIRISTNKGIPIVMKRGTYIEKNFVDIVAKIIK